MSPRRLHLLYSVPLVLLFAFAGCNTSVPAPADHSPDSTAEGTVAPDGQTEGVAGDNVTAPPEPSLYQEPSLAAGSIPDAYDESQMQLRKTVNKWVVPLLKHDWVKGCVVGVVDGDVQAVFCYGVTRNGGGPVTPKTVFAIGSVSKTVTGVLLQQMQDQGEVAEADAVDMYLPKGIKAPRDDAGKTFTLGQLASQTSGLPYIPSNFGSDLRDNPYVNYTADKLFTFINTFQLSRAGGTEYQYSNTGAALLGELLARRAGKSYEALAIERIMKPLGMIHTRVSLSPAMKQLKATGHNADGYPVGGWNFDVFAPAGGWCSTGEDMMKYLKASLGDTPKGAAAGAASVIGAMAKSQEQRFAINEQSGTALAWHLINKPGVVWHNGGTYGFASQLAVSPLRHRGVFILANTGTNCAGLGVVTEAGFGVLYDLMGEHYSMQQTVYAAGKVSNARQKACVGHYYIGKQEIFSVEFKKGALWVNFPSSPPLRLFPQTDTHYFMKSANVQITFTKDEMGYATSAVLHDSGKDIKVTKQH